MCTCEGTNKGMEIDNETKGKRKTEAYSVLNNTSELSSADPFSCLKPTRDWVMLELERLGVRVVSGRLGRKAGEEDDAEKKAAGKQRTEACECLP